MMYHIMKQSYHGALISCPCILQSEWHHFVAEGTCCTPKFFLPYSSRWLKGDTVKPSPKPVQNQGFGSFKEFGVSTCSIKSHRPIYIGNNSNYIMRPDSIFIHHIHNLVWYNRCKKFQYFLILHHQILGYFITKKLS